MILLLLASGIGWLLVGVLLLCVVIAFILACKDAHNKLKEQQRIKTEDEIFNEMRDREGDIED